MRILLVRHGDTEIGPDGLYPETAALTDLGLRQAEATARVLAPAGITHIVSSALLRSIETAALLAEMTGLPCRQVAGLDEVRIGSLRTAPLEVIARRIYHTTPYADFSEFGGENTAEYYERVLYALSREIVDRHDGSPATVAAFLHGGTISVILDHAEGHRFDGRLHREIPNCSISIVTVEKRVLRLEHGPDAGHLEEVGITHMHGTQTAD